jgi:outer membrane biosynthesis protein TonB
MAGDHNGSGSPRRLLLMCGSMLLGGLSIATAIAAIRGWDPLPSAPSPTPAPAAAPQPEPPSPRPTLDVPSPVAPPAVAPPPVEAPREPQSAAPPPPAKPAASPAPSPAPVPMEPRPTAGSYVVQLGAFPSEALAEQTWTAASARLASVVDGRPHRIDRVEVDGRQVFRLLTTGFASSAEAQIFCRRLKSAGQDCFVRP